jgi:predicted phage tail protein
MKSTESASVTPRTVPNLPTSVALTAAVGKVTVGWDAPAWDGGASITSYRVNAYSNAAATVQVGSAVVVSGSPLATSVDVTGLSAGVEYWFRVEAVNAAGASLKKWKLPGSSCPKLPLSACPAYAGLR